MGIRMRDEVPDDERDPDLIRGFGLFNAPIRPRDPVSLRFWKAASKFWMDQSGYSHVNMTVPQSFAFSVADSPVGAAIRIYWESHNHPWKVKPGDRITVPTGVLSFPKDIVPLLKERVEQYYNVTRFRYMESGGHYGIFEQAEEYARELGEFFRPLR